MNEPVLLKRGISAELPSSIIPGTIWFETDTGRLSIDTETTRVTVNGNDPTRLSLTGGTLSGPLYLPTEQSTATTAAVHYGYVTGLLNQNMNDVYDQLTTVSTNIENIQTSVTTLETKVEQVGSGVDPATVAPKAPGTAAVGTSLKYAREDHVHPLQTEVSGNSGSTTKLKDKVQIKLVGDVSGSVKTNFYDIGFVDQIIGGAGDVEFEDSDFRAIEIETYLNTSSGGGLVTSDTAPSDTSVGWVDTSIGGVLKYYNAASSSWQPTLAVWG